MARLGFLLPMNLSFFGGGTGGGGFRHQRKRRQTGNTPGDNKKQNKQFDDAVRQLAKEGIELSQKQIRQLHDAISRQGFGFWDIVEMGRNLFG